MRTWVDLGTDRRSAGDAAARPSDGPLRARAVPLAPGGRLAGAGQRLPRPAAPACRGPGPSGATTGAARAAAGAGRRTRRMGGSGRAREKLAGGGSGRFWAWEIAMMSHDVVIAAGGYAEAGGMPAPKSRGARRAAAGRRLPLLPDLRGGPCALGLEAGYYKGYAMTKSAGRRAVRRRGALARGSSAAGSPAPPRPSRGPRRCGPLRRPLGPRPAPREGPAGATHGPTAPPHLRGRG